MGFSHADHQHMARALRLAEKGRFTTSPNPNVGCVLVSPSGEIIGEGWHQQAGGPHAEVFALRDAGDLAKGATAYVTLEPCSHHGRTPPCADALIKAGVARLVCAMQDANPKVAGQGIQRLIDAGVEVQVGLMESESHKLNHGFFTRMTKGRPHITVKMAASLDGKTAMANGHSQWITSALARADVQRQRAQSCAILTGSGTVLIDNPSLNVRLSAEELGLVDLAVRQPLRVIVDSRNQLDPDKQIFQLPGDILLANKQVSPHLFPKSVRQWHCTSKGSRVDLAALMMHLGELGINNLWVEAGAALTGALLEQQLVDTLVLYQAPKLMGDKAKGLALLPSLTHMEQAISLKWQDIRQVGEDLRLTADVQYQS
ncbi:bifunctional diaminohydroxyphosphoribosylaminopyrimidine deaminase/5-amino-6-(5-phosphoribosylamino)uracil reductase RibD [Aliiglaciecola sp. CAU 1673]|uniref:bifunctional diaminohydroxyphosphoribosylaminopyrimidine deaminase/5-amino-6-(5-phosphoribosylamino)uracil reductase RibD n=1 Tax=Aliiglaciecola sp. CAU 1673 TaxID=3032595 RepID=UPI0023D9E32C|nr:bifunctional diaminohydroxyphosphoribosylaminopyrimidine deaminase/5-amino-6-(5-phosphoribosylamino)uracil reductase RibD [Aliiglaciecola sp. CAU 1673]MDF2178017.1 bifunctional diaminohydroxyphosphoribosylaminopyrimidine deaminase/5-amino-6-(5-phosphoribosylamino)uracil reductase RibD [Aliiglaciecola sp. CAU 1673]